MKLLAPSLFLAFAIFGLKSYSQYSWQELTTSPVTLDINAVDFIDELEGWIICDGGDIWHTADGGVTWDDRRFLSTTINGHDIQFLNDSIGVACGAFGITLRTKNGGLDWFPTYLGTEMILEDIYMTSASTGFVVGEDTSLGQGVVFETVDSGATWTPVTVPSSVAFYGIDVSGTSPDKLIVSGKDNVIISSNDGGSTWAVATFGGGALPSPMGWEAVHLLDDALGYAVGFDNEMAFTTDAGASWVVLPAVSAPGESYRDIEMYTAELIIRVGTDGISWTEDGGSGWLDPGFTVPVAQLEGISIVDNETAYIVGDQGIIYKSPVPPSFDLAVESYISPTEICGEGMFPVEVVIKNDGAVTATDAIINLKDASGGNLLSVNWSGSLDPGLTDTVYLGLLSISSDQTVTVEIVGDTFSDNNFLNQDLSWIFPVGVGADSPVRYCQGESITLNAYGGLSYHWINGYDLSDSLVANPIANPSNDISYFVAIDAPWCFGTFEVVVMESDLCDQQPTVFTPNGDGENDIFYVEGVDPNAESDFYIYSRWGTEIMYIANYDNLSSSWDGTGYNEEYLPTGTYFYVYDNLETGFQSSGWVQLLR